MKLIETKKIQTQRYRIALAGKTVKEFKEEVEKQKQILEALK